MPKQKQQSRKPRRRRAAPRQAPPRLGLRHWTERVLDTAERVAHAFEPDPVHDLRVAIRRCRSMAEGLRSIDPVRDWREFRAMAKPLFLALGQLRDVQVMEQWRARLASGDDLLAQRLVASFAAREHALKVSAREALAAFDRKRWLKLGRRLDRRVRSLRPGSLVLQLLALERLLAAQRMHDRALTTRRAADLHRLRIAIKRFRYTVENFLPEHHARWKRDLKRVQDLLGDIHDLDVLQQEVARAPDTAGPVRESWFARIAAARASRLSEYLDMIRARDLWAQWRAALPSGRQLAMAIEVKLTRWSAALDRDRARSRRIARGAVALWRVLRDAFAWESHGRSLQRLRVAARLCGVGSATRKRKRDEYLARKLARLPVPVGWTRRELAVACLAARCGACSVPLNSDRQFVRLPQKLQREVLRLAGVLRLAAALDRARAGTVIVPQVDSRDGLRVLRVRGLDQLSAAAEELAAARHLLECAEGMPLLVLPAVAPVRRRIINR